MVASKSSEIIKRLRHENVSFCSNDTIAQHLSREDIKEIQSELERGFEGILDSLLIDWRNDSNAKETPKRVAKMYINELYRGRFFSEPKVTEFPNTKNLDELYVVGPITVRSTCSHHMVPITGEVWIGILPTDKVLGLSKFARVTDWVMSRPHIQEEATIMLADKIEEMLKPEALAVVFKAKHLCMLHRGVREKETSMITSVLRGAFKEDPAIRAELFKLFEAQGF